MRIVFGIGGCGNQGLVWLAIITFWLFPSLDATAAQPAQEDIAGAIEVTVGVEATLEAVEGLVAAEFGMDGTTVSTGLGGVVLVAQDHVTPQEFVGLGQQTDAEVGVGPAQQGMHGLGADFMDTVLDHAGGIKLGQQDDIVGLAQEVHQLGMHLVDQMADALVGTGQHLVHASPVLAVHVRRCGMGLEVVHVPAQALETGHVMRHPVNGNAGGVIQCGKGADTRVDGHHRLCWRQMNRGFGWVDTYGR